MGYNNGKRAELPVTAPAQLICAPEKDALKLELVGTFTLALGYFFLFPEVKPRMPSTMFVIRLSSENTSKIVITTTSLVLSKVRPFFRSLTEVVIAYVSDNVNE